MTTRRLWITWTLLAISGLGYFAFAVMVDNTSAKRAILPGETTHGHYQIELACAACHTEFGGVIQDACANCHADELERGQDTHPAIKFNDPTNADRLAKIDAQKCITCHREHVPDRTHEMGLSLPKDYCWHCHEDVAEQRPSHAGMKHDSCATAGCHNYHDNSALYEKFLYANRDQPDVLPDASVIRRQLLEQWQDGHAKSKKPVAPLAADQADAPSDLLLKPIVAEWSTTAHAAAGVNCRGCHEVSSSDEKIKTWKNKIDHSSCSECHATEAESFMKGKHGMRLAHGMSPMEPVMARALMHEESAHKTLDCSACHKPHGYDSRYAAVNACIACHDDEHTNNYLNSRHYELWKEEASGEKSTKGTGVSCATCHMPRIEEDGRVYVQHNQNDNLRPNEKMIRSVCMSCHGLEFSLNSLADSLLIQNCFTGQPQVTVPSVQMATDWFTERERQKQRRKEN